MKQHNIPVEEVSEEEFLAIEIALRECQRKKVVSSFQKAEFHDHSKGDDSKTSPSFIKIEREKIDDNGMPLLKRKLPQWALSPCSSHREFYMRFPGSIMYAVSKHEAEESAHRLWRHLEQQKKTEECFITVGFDTEWKPNFKRGFPQHKTALVQICPDENLCYLFHIYHSGVPPTLRKILEDPLIQKAGIGSTGDANKLEREFEVKVEGVVDLATFASRKLTGSSYCERWSLSDLSEELLKKKVSKPDKIRKGNWEVIPLSEAQKIYAATDAFVSWKLFKQLANMLDNEIENDTKLV